MNVLFNLNILTIRLEKKVRISARVSQGPLGASWRESSQVLGSLGEDKQVRTDRALELSRQGGLGDGLGPELW